MLILMQRRMQNVSQTSQKFLKTHPQTPVIILPDTSSQTECVTDKLQIAYFFMDQRKISSRVILKMKIVVIPQPAIISIDLQIRNFFPSRCLLYSETTSCVFYFCCLCSDKGSRTSVTNDGFSDWTCIPTIQKTEENVTDMIPIG